MPHKATFRGADSITSNDPRQSRGHCDVSRSKRLDRVADATPAGVDRYRPGKDVTIDLTGAGDLSELNLERFP